MFSSPVAAATDDEVNPGDQLNVTVYNHPELSQSIKVDSRGGIYLPLVGYTIVTGMPLRKIDDTLAHRLSPYISFPAVDVQRTNEVESLFVAGAPGGVLVFSPGETLATAIADVEKYLEQKDPTENNRLVLTDVIDHSRIDLHRVGVQRGGKLLGVYDLVALRSTNDPGPLLDANDTIVFRNKPIPVYVGGAVEKPGRAYLDPDEPLSDAVLQAGGTLPTAASAHVLLTTADGTTSVALGDPALFAPASVDERIEIPVAPHVQVNGLVARPGPVVLSNDFTLLGAINSAGGINKFGNLKNVTLVRDGKAVSYDITKLSFGDMEENPTLKDGDSVFVPDGHKIDFSTFLQTVLGIHDFGVIK